MCCLHGGNYTAANAVCCCVHSDWLAGVRHILLRSVYVNRNGTPSNFENEPSGQVKTDDDATVAYRPEADKGKSVSAHLPTVFCYAFPTVFLLSRVILILSYVILHAYMPYIFIYNICRLGYSHTQAKPHSQSHRNTPNRFLGFSTTQHTNACRFLCFCTHTHIPHFIVSRSRTIWWTFPVCSPKIHPPFWLLLTLCVSLSECVVAYLQMGITMSGFAVS